MYFTPMWYMSILLAVSSFHPVMIEMRWFQGLRYQGAIVYWTLSILCVISFHFDVKGLQFIELFSSVVHLFILIWRGCTLYSLLNSFHIMWVYFHFDIKGLQFIELYSYDMHIFTSWKYAYHMNRVCVHESTRM